MAWYFPWIRIVPEYQRAAVFRLGRIKGFRGPGMIWFSPMFEKLRMVDLRIVSQGVPTQECITRDNIPVHVTATVFYKVSQPDKAVVEVENYHRATLQMAQTGLRSIIGEETFDNLIADQGRAASRIRQIMDEATTAWGVDVTRVAIKQLECPDSLKKAMAKEAQAERERRAMVIRAQGEKEAAELLSEAASLLDASANGFQMRYLHTLVQVSEAGNVVVFGAADE